MSKKVMLSTKNRHRRRRNVAVKLKKTVEYCPKKYESSPVKSDGSKLKNIFSVNVLLATA